MIKILSSALLALLGVAADAATPRLVVVELFQSQGCSSCPPANANLNAIAGRADVLALSFGVTYWDQLGWKDSFAQPAFTARQWDYARARRRPNVWTPQVYLNGRADIVGSDRAQLDAAIARARPAADAPTLTLSAAGVSVGPGAGGDVWLARYDPREVPVAIRAGENGGRTLPHRNVVRELVRLGRWTGKAQRFDLPATTRPGLATAAFVQTGPGGAIVAAAKLGL